MKTKVFINGHEGTTGLRIVERLSNRSDIELISIADELRKDMTEIKKRINMADIVFLCLPDAAAQEAVAMAEGNDHVKFIDASTAHRTREDWAYGFPELSSLHRKKIQAGKRIAVPGCHASGFISLVYPLVAAGLLPKDYPLSCFSLTGYSGGGKKMIAQYESLNRLVELDAPRQYGLTQQHKHLKEMKYICGLAGAPIFSPIVSDYYSGMAVTIPLFTDLLAGKPTVEAVWNAYSEHYKGANLVKVLPLDQEEIKSGFLSGNINSGYDNLEIMVTGNDDRIVVHAVFDNLGKGASGAAVQCMNIMMGLPEDTGLCIK